MLRQIISWHIRIIRDELFPSRSGTSASAMPPVRTALIVVLGGLFLPFVVALDTRPAELADDLARQRIERFLLEHEQGEVAGLLPAGEILTRRPAFVWKAHPDAVRYGLRLYAGDTLYIGTDRIGQTRFVMQPPGRLDTSRDYRFEITAFDKEGRRLDWKQEGAFRVKPTPEELSRLAADARRELDGAAADLVLTGYFAVHGSVSDVVAGACACGEHSVLRRLGYHD